MNKPKTFKPKGWPRFVSCFFVGQLRFQKRRGGMWFFTAQNGVTIGSGVGDVRKALRNGRHYIHPSKARRICPAGYWEAMKK